MKLTKRAIGQFERICRQAKAFQDRLEESNPEAFIELDNNTINLYDGKEIVFSIDFSGKKGEGLTTNVKEVNQETVENIEDVLETSDNIQEEEKKIENPFDGFDAEVFSIACEFEKFTITDLTSKFSKDEKEKVKKIFNNKMKDKYFYKLNEKIDGKNVYCIK